MNVEDYTLAVGALGYWVSVGHKCDFLIVLLDSKPEGIGLWPEHGQMLWQCSHLFQLGHIF